MRSDLPVDPALPNWSVNTLGALCQGGGGDIQTGPFGSQLHAADYVDDGVPAIMPQDLVDGRIDVARIARITEEDARRLARYRVREGDIVYSRRGDIRRCTLIRAEQNGWLCGTGCLRVRIGDSADPRYIAVYLGHPSVQEWIERHAVGATMLNLNTSILSGLPVVVPGISEQHRIVAVFSALDDKIESDRRLARLLEETAATLFRARFVDFVGIDEFEESEIGRIPRGWRVGALTDLARFVNGKAFTKHANGRGRPILRIRELHNGIDQGTPRSDLDADDDLVARFDDILFAWSGSLGAYRWPGDESLINQHIFKVIPDGWPAWFVSAWLEEHMETFRAIARDKATTMGHIQRRHLVEARVPVPTAQVISEADGVIGPLDRQRATLVGESRTLGLVRDALLPKLVSGQIRVPDTAEPAEMIELAAETLAAGP